MRSIRTATLIIPAAAFLLAAEHIAFEYFNGGVKPTSATSRALFPKKVLINRELPVHLGQLRRAFAGID